jgi:hypothetical protein
MVAMADDIETHIADIQALYEPLIASSDSRLDGGSKLWRQFNDTVSTYRIRGRAAFAGVIERVNELTVARILLSDPTLADCRICYEPEVGGNPTKIDFIVPTPTSGTIYVEVETVRPTAHDSDENWKKYQQRRKLHPSNVDYIVDKAWMGATVYGIRFPLDQSLWIIRGHLRHGF